MDYVQCWGCDFEGLVPQLERRCPKCKENNTLRWTYSKCCSTKIVGEKDHKYCGKCGTKI